MSERDTSVSLHFYGLDLRLQSADRNAVENIRRDFSYFESAAGTPEVTIEVFDESPSFISLPNLTASNYGLNYICYRGAEAVFTDYFGQGLRVFNSQTKNYQIFTKSADLKHEISYLTILSVVGQFLDSKHIHRVHALGISQNGKAILILLPMGGGKTTLALRLLQSGEVKLLSEDSPLVTRCGEILPFPLRLGVVPGDELSIPKKYLRTMHMAKFGTKILVDVDYFADKISSACQPGAILLGERILGCESKIEPAGKLGAGKAFIKNSVVGLGLHQGVEYILGQSIWETLGKTGLAFSRLNSSLKVITQSRVYRYVLGHDIERNHQVLLDFIRSLEL